MKPRLNGPREGMLEAREGSCFMIFFHFFKSILPEYFFSFDFSLEKWGIRLTCCTYRYPSFLFQKHFGFSILNLESHRWRSAIFPVRYIAASAKISAEAAKEAADRGRSRSILDSRASTPSIGIV